MKPVICFDWDGTLCDSMELCIQENRTTLLKMGLPDQPDKVLRRCNGPTFEEAAPFIGIPADRMDEYCRIRLACALDLVPKVNRLFPGAKELLAAGVEVGYSKEVKSGFKVGAKDGGYYIAFTDESFEALLDEYLREKVSQLLFA